MNNEKTNEIMNNENTTEQSKAEKRNKVILLIYRIFVCLGIIAIILLLLFKPCNCRCNCASSNEKTYFDTKIDDSIDEYDNEDKVSDLNKRVEDGMITISMNADPAFETASSKGNLLIENSEKNKHPQVVQIYTKDDNKLIYTSDMIPIGKTLKEDTLDVKLSKGNYKCTAYFNAVDETSGEKLGTAAADITVHIQG